MQGHRLLSLISNWGIEKEYTPNATQKKLAHLAIDEGADLVIGHHHMYWKALKSIMENILPTVWETSVWGK